MSKHKSEDYKISAVKYYLNNDVSLVGVCVIKEWEHYLDKIIIKHI